MLLFTDTLGDVNGVSRFIRNAAAEAARTGRELTVVTSTNFEVPREENLVNFRPRLAMKMPRYEHLELVMAPAAAMLSYARQFKPDAIHISTPGPVGCVGWWAARAVAAAGWGCITRTSPRTWSTQPGHEAMTRLTAGFMRRFYGGFAAIFTRSREYVRSLTALGVDERRVVALRPGIMVGEFRPRWNRGNRGDGGGRADSSAGEGEEQEIGNLKSEISNQGGRVVRVLSVGRVSVEKNMPLLVRVWKAADSRLKAEGLEAELAVVGDGPYRSEMEEQLRGTRERGFWGSGMARS